MIFYMIVFVIIGYLFRKQILFLFGKGIEISDKVKEAKKSERRRSSVIRNWIKTRKKVWKLRDEL